MTDIKAPNVVERLRVHIWAVEIETGKPPTEILLTRYQRDLLAMQSGPMVGLDIDADQIERFMGIPITIASDPSKSTLRALMGKEGEDG